MGGGIPPGILWLRTGLVAQVWGGLGLPNPPTNSTIQGGTFAENPLVLYGFTIQAGGFWSYYYTAAGIHATHVLAGMVIMVFIAMAALKNRDLHRVELVGIYWHFVDIVWIFLFPLLYIAK